MFLFKSRNLISKSYESKVLSARQAINLWRFWGGSIEMAFLIFFFFLDLSSIGQFGPWFGQVGFNCFYVALIVYHTNPNAWHCQ